MGIEKDGDEAPINLNLDVYQVPETPINVLESMVGWQDLGPEAPRSDSQQHTNVLVETAEIDPESMDGRHGIRYPYRVTRS